MGRRIAKKKGQRGEKVVARSEEGPVDLHNRFAHNEHCLFLLEVAVMQALGEK